MCIVSAMFDSIKIKKIFAVRVYCWLDCVIVCKRDQNYFLNVKDENMILIWYLYDVSNNGKIDNMYIERIKNGDKLIEANRKIIINIYGVSIWLHPWPIVPPKPLVSLTEFAAPSESKFIVKINLFNYSDYGWFFRHYLLIL